MYMRHAECTAETAINLDKTKRCANTGLRHQHKQRISFTHVQKLKENTSMQGAENKTLSPYFLLSNDDKTR